ncbi:DUF1176 domain-containing protein [Stakelama saccharophila]|uniref:DUF1176 domain-containing protein n=1 Tax=Stakelama saccharophila TaxID=3075605 RepID=A0ABZ0BAW4_9SPHN|nr:DUF1176 domain-containing protein [Stakelama sp. W311]WNO54347.1 DUF1176 domain-containing protein [Stakelama sp. W311]
MMIAALALATMLQPTDMKVFGHWTVSCDDGRRCVAMEMKNPHKLNALHDASMRITRGARGGMTVEIWPGRKVAAPVTIRIGKTLVYRGRIKGDVLRLTGERGVRAARAAATAAGDGFVIRADDGSYSGTVPLYGVSHSLRYMDQQQGRDHASFA